MANQTLTAISNYDEAALTGLNNGETITINAGAMTINSDVRWAQNAAIFGSITISTTLGGSMLVDGSDVWEIAFDASSGNVPTTNAYGSNGVTGGTSGATGELLRVWATGSLTPSAAGGAMPATGWIKLRTKTGTFQDNEVITLPGGATVTVNSATGGKRSWIHVVGLETGTVTVPRLGSFTVDGDWYELGTTNGSDDQTFQFPVADACPAIWVETSAGSGVYEKWLNAGSRWGTATVYVPQDVRGKYFGMVNSTGVITIARRASNACGYKPSSGCKVRIPNVIFSSTTAADYAANTINATLTTRYDFTTSNAGVIAISYASMNWYLNVTNPFSVNVENSAFLHAIRFSNVASTVSLIDWAVGLDGTLETTSITFSVVYNGTTIDNGRAARYAASAADQHVFSFADCSQIDISDTIAEMFGSTTAITRDNTSVTAFFLQRVSDVTLTDCIAIGASFLRATPAKTVVCTGALYADLIGGATTTTTAVSAILVEALSSDIFIDGFSSFGGLANVHPYTGILSISGSSSRIRFRNLGTAAAPYNGGSTNAMGVIATLNGAAIDLEFQRCYTENLRTAAFAFGNNTQEIICDNVWGDGVDSQAIISSLITPRGCRWTHSQAGQAAIYGSHWQDAFISTTQGRIAIAANEPFAATADQVTATYGAGSGWTASGSIALITANETVEWTMPYFALGHTGLGGLSPFVVGTNPQNFDYDYQIDTGSGYSAWKQLMTCRVRASGGTAGTNTFVITGITGGSRDPQIGDYVGTLAGTNFAAGTTITNIVGNTITVSANILVSLGSVAVFFWNALEAETVSASTGFRLKVKATVKTAAAGNLLTYISIPTKTDSTSQQTQYPLTGVTLTLTGLVSGSDIVILDAGTETERSNIDANIGTTYDYGFTTGGSVDICIYKAGYVPYTIRAYTLPSVDSSLPIAQQPDRNYTP